MISANGLKFSKFISSLILFGGLFAQAQSIAPVKATPTAPPANNFVALCYHDVSNGFVGNAFSIRRKDLVDQFDFLKAHYNVISLQDILDANQGKKTLPEKAVLLTFDDGLSSFYEIVYPLLKTYKFKAVYAIVGKWTEEGAAPDYGFKDSNPKMTDWAQLKEMSDSGFVDVASHTYDMHQDQVFNPQGGRNAVTSFFKYDAVTKSFQSEEDFSAHVEADLKKNNELIKTNLGKDNTVIAWPYGASNALSRKAAENVGLNVQMSLRVGLSSANDLTHIGRGLVFADMDIPQFAAALEQGFVDQNPLRMLRVDLDKIWKKTEAETEQSLGDLLEQTLALGPNGVLLQAISDSDEAYFATTHLKVKGDYLSRTAHTMRYRAHVPYVYARLPYSFLKNTKTATAAIRDLARYTDIDGVFFEVPAKEKLKKISFESFMEAGRSIRPRWQFGLIGQYPTHNADLFDYVMLTPPQVEKDKALLTAPQNKSMKLIVALPKDFKSDASHLISHGYLNLFYDVNFKGFIPDTDFKNVFSVRQRISQHLKGEAK